MEDGLGAATNDEAWTALAGVLILVLVEDGLGECHRQPLKLKKYEVLILVLVEDGLGAYGRGCIFHNPPSLNPCFSGGWSRRMEKTKKGRGPSKVLILVLVEDGLGDPKGSSSDLA